MEVLSLPERTFVGITARTSNDKEMKPETAQIHGLWTRFWNDVGTPLQAQNCFGLYSSYESDRNGDYTLLAGMEPTQTTDIPEGLESITSKAGRYLVFRNKGTMPQVVMQTWTEVWEYFDDESSEYTRAYLTDIEEYPSMEEVILYISIL
jgi:predicted transcriptional regulator YdeE